MESGLETSDAPQSSVFSFQEFPSDLTGLIVYMIDIRFVFRLTLSCQLFNQGSMIKRLHTIRLNALDHFYVMGPIMTSLECRVGDLGSLRRLELSNILLFGGFTDSSTRHSCINLLQHLRFQIKSIKILHEWSQTEFKVPEQFGMEILQTCDPQSIETLEFMLPYEATLDMSTWSSGPLTKLKKLRVDISRAPALFHWAENLEYLSIWVFGADADAFEALGVATQGMKQLQIIDFILVHQERPKFFYPGKILKNCANYHLDVSKLRINGRSLYEDLLLSSHYANVPFDAKEFQTILFALHGSLDAESQLESALDPARVWLQRSSVNLHRTTALTELLQSLTQKLKEKDTMAVNFWIPMILGRAWSAHNAKRTKQYWKQLFSTDPETFSHNLGNNSDILPFSMYIAVLKDLDLIGLRSQLIELARNDVDRFLQRDAHSLGHLLFHEPITNMLLQQIPLLTKQSALNLSRAAMMRGLAESWAVNEGLVERLSQILDSTWAFHRIVDRDFACMDLLSGFLYNHPTQAEVKFRFILLRQAPSSQLAELFVHHHDIADIYAMIGDSGFNSQNLLTRLWKAPLLILSGYYPHIETFDFNLYLQQLRSIDQRIPDVISALVAPGWKSRKALSGWNYAALEWLEKVVQDHQATEVS